MAATCSVGGLPICRERDRVVDMLGQRALEMLDERQELSVATCSEGSRDAERMTRDVGMPRARQELSVATCSVRGLTRCWMHDKSCLWRHARSEGSRDVVCDTESSTCSLSPPGIPTSLVAYTASRHPSDRACRHYLKMPDTAHRPDCVSVILVAAPPAPGMTEHVGREGHPHMTSRRLLSRTRLLNNHLFFPLHGVPKCDKCTN